MAAAYATLVSAMNIINSLHHHPRPPISLPIQQVESLTQKIHFLLQFLEGYNNPHRDYSKEADPLESRIADAAYAAEYAIESHILDQFTNNNGENMRSDDLYEALEKVIQDMASIEEEAKQIQGQHQLHTKSMPPDSSRSSSILQQSSMVGADDVKDHLMDKLISHCHDLQIIPIVGMGGSATKMFAAHNFLSLACLLLFNLLPLVSSHDDQHTSKHNLHQKVTPKLSYQIKLHGFLLWASVGFLMPISVLIKRISNSNPSPTKLTITFYTHAITQVCAVLLATAGGLISIKYFDNSFSNHHQKIGLLFYAAILLQTMLSIWRPQRGSRGRKIWFVFHWLVGIAALLVGVMNVFTGLEAYHERILEDVRIWRVVFMVELCLMLLVYLLQEKWQYLTHQHKTEAC